MRAAIVALIAAFGAMTAWADDSQDVQLMNAIEQIVGGDKDEIAQMLKKYDTKIKKYKDYTPEQMRDLPKEELKNSVPVLYSKAMQRGLARDSQLAFTADLNTLMYPAISDYGGSIKAFQTDMGDKPNGVLTVWQIAKLQERANMQKLAPVGFPSISYSRITSDRASIGGTTVMIDMFDENRIFPINHVTVECYKSDGYCEVNTIVLATPNSQTQQYHVMDIGENVYKITRWENGNIDGVIVGRPDACRTSSISYNFKAKEFFETTRNTEHECIIAGSKLPKPSITQIVEGGKIIREEFAKIQQRAYSYLSSAFRRQVDELKNRYSVKVKKPGR